MEHLSSETKAEIVQMVYPEYANNPATLEPIWPFIVPVKPLDSQQDQEAVRRLEIELNEAGTAVVKARTTKLSNLRFNIKDALKEAPELTLETVSVIHESFGPLGPALLILRLLRAAFDLSAVELSPTDGMVLIELFKFAKEEHVIKTDGFLAHMKSKMDVRTLYGSLNKLEKLNCIDRSDSDTEIKLIETIIFK